MYELEYTRLCSVQWTLACPSNNQHVKYKRMKWLVKANMLMLLYIVHVIRRVRKASIKLSVFWARKFCLLIQHSFVALMAIGEIFKVLQVDQLYGWHHFQQPNELRRELFDLLFITLFLLTSIYSHILCFCFWILSFSHRCFPCNLT